MRAALAEGSNEVSRESSSPSRRLVVLGVAHLGVGWAATVLAPVWVLLLAPLLFGVPHVLNDLRLLVLQPPLRVAHGLYAAIVAPLVGLTLLRAGVLLGAPRHATLEVALGFAAVVGAAWVALRKAVPGRGDRRPRWRRARLSLGLAVLGGVCSARPQLCAVVLAHAHNLVAVGLWLAFMKRASVSARARAGLAVGFLLLAGALLGGLAPAWSTAPVAGLAFEGLRAVLAPGMSAAAGDRVVLSFAFAQLVHYSIWLFLLPACAWGVRERRTVRTFVDELTGGLGRASVTLALVALLALPFLGLLDPTGARSAYLTLVLFHGWLEIALVTYWLAGRGAEEASTR